MLIIPDCHRTEGENKAIHRCWHYVDLPFSRDGTALKQPAKPNLVGDVHQPLHATARLFSQNSPDGDQGENEVALCEKPCRKNLHSFWDDAAGTRTGISS